MEAEDTVMSLGDTGNESLRIQMEKILKAQAEITWDIAFQAGKQEGIREVVEWIKQQSRLERCDPDVMAYFNEYRWVDETEYQAKLKEWGDRMIDKSTFRVGECPECEGYKEIIKRTKRLMGATYAEDDPYKGDEHFEPCSTCKGTGKS